MRGALEILLGLWPWRMRERERERESGPLFMPSQRGEEGRGGSNNRGQTNIYHEFSFVEQSFFRTLFLLQFDS